MFCCILYICLVKSILPYVSSQYHQQDRHDILFAGDIGLGFEEQLSPQQSEFTTYYHEEINSTKLYNRWFR